nr:PREDICTED: probable sodium/potassium/calcium exchanger CG1090 isoform X3 [Bemisia tabaci]XP_018907022.1 PREDICTED: probable sodium/potassium/calcium exchanger CG1090 isoform X3 [Bemisia tabaci]
MRACDGPGPRAPLPSAGRRGRRRWAALGVWALVAVACALLESQTGAQDTGAPAPTTLPTVRPTAAPTSRGPAGKPTRAPRSKSTSTTTTGLPVTGNRTARPEMTTATPGKAGSGDGRRNCTPPAIEQFPRPLMGQSARRHGGLILHIIICVYTFVGLAIVCDDYFVTALDCICEALKLQPDVAGATFMAAGSSAPELATVIIGVFFAKDDIGVSGVIGSAIFNIMFVISVCALFAGTVSYLNWWPLCRDLIFYAASILIMLVGVANESVTWLESLIMLLMYVFYCFCLYHNTLIEAWANSLSITAICREAQPVRDETSQLFNQKPPEDPSKPPQSGPYYTNEMATDENGVAQPTPAQPSVQTQYQQQPAYYVPKDHGPATNPLEKPTDPNPLVLAQWYLTYPIHWMCRATMPDCRTEEYKSWYPFTFTIAMIWISIYSYIMVWMITVIGDTLGIPDTMMGLTFVAAGVSVPDALSSLAVAKEGYGDMAVSNAVGSNVFDILVCLGLPWFLQTAVFKPGSRVRVYSKGLTYSTLSLFSTVVFLILATHYNGWKLDKKFGIILMVWYAVFISFASLYELNVFGVMNPPQCLSDY